MAYPWDDSLDVALMQLCRRWNRVQNRFPAAVGKGCTFQLEHAAELCWLEADTD
jgi:hypothetical protein